MFNTKSLLITLFIASGVVTSALAEPKPLPKSDAAKILASMGYERVTVAFIIQGAVPMAATQNAAMVSAMGVFNGKLQKVEKQFFYDNDLGWFCTEDGTDKNTGQVTFIRLWTVSGYSVVTQGPPKQ